MNLRPFFASAFFCKGKSLLSLFAIQRCDRPWSLVYLPTNYNIHNSRHLFLSINKQHKESLSTTQRFLVVFFTENISTMVPQNPDYNNNIIWFNCIVCYSINNSPVALSRSPTYNMKIRRKKKYANWALAQYYDNYS